MAIRWINDGEPHAAEVYNRPLRDYVQEVETDYVKQATRINVGNGLVGGGALVGTTLDINGVDASASQKGVVRFATLAEANNGTAGVAVSPDVLKDISGQPTFVGKYITNGAVNNTITVSGIVSALALEVGDVIEISGSTGGQNDKLYTVDRIDGNNSIIVNYEHAGNRGNGRLKLANQTATVTFKRIAKWYNAPSGMGQAWVNVAGVRKAKTTYTNTTGRSIMVVVSMNQSWHGGSRGVSISVDGVGVGRVDTGTNSDGSISAIIPPGSQYSVGITVSNHTWAELR